MNEWCTYIALYCVLLYTQSASQSCGRGGGGGGGPLLNHHQCAAFTWMRWLPQDNGASALTTHQLQVERRESHRANQVDGDYWEASGGNLSGHQGYTPTLYKKCHGIFNVHREPDLSLTSHPKDGCLMRLENTWQEIKDHSSIQNLKIL